MKAAALALALLALACGSGSEDEPGSIVASSGAVETWLPSDHPAAAAQARWGLPITCPSFAVVVLPLAELQTVCNTAEQLAARASDVQTEGCVRRLHCELTIAAELTPARRELVLTHELGHLLDPQGVDRHLDCGDAPGAALMCARGPASGSPEPTLADFDMVVP